MNLFQNFKMPRLRLPSLYADDKKPRKAPNYLLWAFLLPFLGMLAVMVIGRYEPFGPDRSMLYSDMYHQYYPFFVNFRKHLLSGESLLYNWDIGMGIDYLGLISYYLASPLNLLSVFVPADFTLEYFSLLAPVKLGFAGLFFAIFLKRLFGKNDFSISVFGAFYGMCAWGLGYHWNVMWLDSFALLPLVALGTVTLLRDKKFILYTITLMLSVLSNYYIGLFVCIFVFLLFICYEICRFQGLRRLCEDLGRIALFSILAIGMTLFLELPALAALQNTQSSVNAFPDSFALNIVDTALCAPAAEAWEAYKAAIEANSGFFECFGLFFTAIGKSFLPVMDGMRQIAGNISGSHVHTFKEGLPNLYCGVGTIFLGFLFLTAKEVKLRDKLCSVALLVFFMLSMLIRQLDYIWHGFHFTNMIPYRFSFLFSFVMLYIAYRAWTLRDSFKLWQFIVAGILSLGLMLCSDERFTFIFLSYNISLLLMILGIFVYMLIDRRMDRNAKEPLPVLVLDRRELKRTQYGTWAILAVMCLELVLNMANFGFRFQYTSITDYPKRYERCQKALDYMYDREKDEDFFRTEVTHAQALNDSALIGYSGISTFTSSANVRITEFMAALGYGAKNTYNRYCFEDGSPVGNMFLNLKYMIDRTDSQAENAYFDPIHTFGNVTLLENNAYLPLGFLANNELASWDISKPLHPFNRDCELFSLATGIDDHVWDITDEKQLSVKAYDVNIVSDSGDGYVTYNAITAGKIRYVYQMNQEGLMCLRISASEHNNFRVYRNGQEVFRENISLPQTFSVSNVQIGDTIIVELHCNANTSGSLMIHSAVLNEDIYRQGVNILSESTLDLTDFSNTLVEGTITCNRDGLLYTSIPYDGNWVVTVDGKPAEAVLVGNCMMALNLTEGTHTIRFVYQNTTFILGLTLSLLCAAAFVALILANRKTCKAKESLARSPAPDKEG